MGVAAKMVGVATTTTAAGVTAHWVLVCLRAPPRGQLWSSNRGSWPQLWRGQRRAEEWRERTFSVGRLFNLLPLVFVLEHGAQRGGHGSRQEVSRAMVGGASGLEAFTLLLRLLITHFDGVDTEEGYTKLHTFRMCNGMPFSDFSREFRALVPTATGSERVLSPGTDVVLEVVRVAANEQFPAPLPALYPVSKATDPRPYASLDALWRAFSDEAHNKTPAANGETFFSSPCFFNGSAVIRSVGAPAR